MDLPYPGVDAPLPRLPDASVAPPELRRHLRRIGLDRADVSAARGLPALLLVLAAGVVLHGDNLFNYPRYQLDEGTYVASAWAVLHGQLSPYTYNYGHPPLGWSLLAVAMQTMGGLFAFGTAIDTGRVFMVCMFVLSAILVYDCARRATGRASAGVLAVALFSFSPLSVNYQRQVLLDNIAAFWVLVALLLLLASRSRLPYLAGSAAALGIAFLSKETMAVLFPAFIYGAWLQASPLQRRFGLVVYGYVAGMFVVAFLLLAALKGELFPTGTLLGGSNAHVSLLTTYLQQAQRGSAQGAFSEQWKAWMQEDGVFMVAGVLALLGTLAISIRRPAVRVIPLLTVSYWLFLARGGVTLNYYLIPIIPLQSLNIAIVLAGGAAGICRLRPLARRSLFRKLVTPAVLIGVAVAIVPYDLPQNQTNLSQNATAPEQQAIRWVGANVPRTATIVVNHYAWVDLRAEGGLGAGYGVPFGNVQMYWEVATDPAIQDRLLHNDWNNIDYLMVDSDMVKDVHDFHMDLIAQAIQHAVPVHTFQNKLFWVTIYQVQHQQP